VSPRARPVGTLLRTATRRLSPADLADEATMAAARCLLLDELDDWANRCGYTRSETRETVTHDGLALTGMMSPRTDGQWPQIHQAIREDEMDRHRMSVLGDPF
jgi:hypothetical protein